MSEQRETETSERKWPGAAALPPGPRMPRAVQAIGWASRPLPFMERCRRRYGDVFTLRILHSGTWVFLCDPDDVKQVFTAAPDALGVSLANPLLGPVLGRRSVMLLEEPSHMTRRKLVLPSFHGQRLHGDGGMIASVTRQQIGRWPVGEPFALWPRMQAITLEVMMSVVFGDRRTARLERLRMLLRELTEWLNEPRRMLALAALGASAIARSRGFRNAIEPVRQVLLEEVRDCRAATGPREDVLSMLATARTEDGELLDEEDVRDELMTLLTDGPTSTSLAWVFERLLRHPAKLSRLREEVLDGGGTYLDAVIKETLRLCPPVATVARKLRRPMRVGEHTLAAGTNVAPCVHLIHRREDVYPSPNSFLPERFVGETPGTYTWIPFGGGVRRCLAASYAQVEMRHVIATVLSEVDLSAVESRSEQLTRSAISFSPAEHGLVTATPHRPRSRPSRAPSSSPTRTAA